MKRLLPFTVARTATAALLAAALVMAAPARAQDLPQSLQGESLFAKRPGTFEQVTMFANCTFTANGAFTLTYTAKGTFGALGPYPGSFTETGTVFGVLTTFLFPGGRTGTVTGWTADFTIDSPSGQVTGKKVLASSTGSEVTCIRSVESTRSSEAKATLAYEATIRTATGTFADRGESVASISEELPRGDVRVFLETFVLSTGVLPTTGMATGGGQVRLGSQPLEEVTFGFNVRKSEEGGRLDGHCNVFDHPTGTHVKCLTVTDYAQLGNSATWEGTADVNGVEEHYRITAQDNGEPNQGIDTFSIKTDTYGAGGNVTLGNVQIHKQQLAP